MPKGGRWYLCWDREDSSRAWFVRARNASEARELLVEAGEIEASEAYRSPSGRVKIRCTQSYHSPCSPKRCRERIIRTSLEEVPW